MAPDALRARFRAGRTFREFVAAAHANCDLWVAMARRARATPEAIARADALPGRRFLLVLNEDWCGDAVNTLPYVAALADASAALELRVVGRDANPDLMDAHLTNGSRSIPIVIVHDAEFRELGVWGPRPAELQAWVLGPGQALDKAERDKEVRRWYARDGGRTTVAELLALLERAG